MRMIYRNACYAFAVVCLIGISTLNQDTAQLKDFIALLQSHNFYQLVGIMTVVLCCLEIAVDSGMEAIFRIIEGAWNMVSSYVRHRKAQH